MFSEVKKMLLELDKQNSEWEKVITAWFENDLDEDQLSNEQQELIEKFKQVLLQTSAIAMQKQASDEQINELFLDRSFASYAADFVIGKLQHYRNFESLRNIGISNPYQAQMVIDIIWEQYILRLNPHIKFDPPFPVDEATYKDTAVELDSFADFCASRQLHVKAMNEQLKKISGLSDELCQYISHKIDKDFEKLKLNFLINQQARQKELLAEIKELLLRRKNEQ